MGSDSHIGPVVAEPRHGDSAGCRYHMAGIAVGLAVRTAGAFDPDPLVPEEIQ